MRFTCRHCACADEGTTEQIVDLIVTGISIRSMAAGWTMMSVDCQHRAADIYVRLYEWSAKTQAGRDAIFSLTLESGSTLSQSPDPF
jgi:hypothetical protein